MTKRRSLGIMVCSLLFLGPLSAVVLGGTGEEPFTPSGSIAPADVTRVPVRYRLVLTYMAEAESCGYAPFTYTVLCPEPHTACGGPAYNRCQQTRWFDTLDEAMAHLERAHLMQRDEVQLYWVEAEPIPLQVTREQVQEPRPPVTTTRYRWSVKE